MADLMWKALSAHREAIIDAAGDHHEKAARALRTLADLAETMRGGYVALQGKHKTRPEPPHPVEEALREEAALHEKAARAQGRVKTHPAKYAQVLAALQERAAGNAQALSLLQEMGSWEA